MAIALLVFNATIVMVILLTETTRLYARIIRSHAALQRERQNKLISLEAMAASISHEMKQPLGAILVNSETAILSLDKAMPDLELAAEALRDIESDVRRANEIFKTIGTLFGRADQELVPVDLNDIGAEALRAMRAEIEERGVKAHADLVPKLPHVMGHRGQLLEVVINLIHNALEAMNAIEGRDRLLTVESRSDDRGTVILTVRDTGPGFDLGRSNEIFDAFVTTKPHGMGLGLAICRRIVERHGGRISASSKEQEGAVFRLTLPINPAAAA